MEINGTPIYSREAMRLTGMAKTEEAKQIEIAVQKVEAIKAQQLEQQQKTFVNMEGHVTGRLVNIFV
jgi:hypothetical protein